MELSLVSEMLNRDRQRISKGEKGGGERMSVKKEAGKKRVQIVFTNDWVKLLDELAEKTGATSRAEAIRYAVTLLDWVNMYLEKGYDIVAVKEEESNEGKVKKISNIGVLGGRFRITRKNLEKVSN